MKKTKKDKRLDAIDAMLIFTLAGLILALTIVIIGH